MLCGERMTNELPEDYVEWLREEVELSKRARLVVDRILEHGSITTAEISNMGYEHPPRAAGDVRDAGVPLHTEMISTDTGRMARYTLLHPHEVQEDRSGGRSVISKESKNELLDTYGSCCAVCGVLYPKRYLQVDHRVPYRIAGDVDAQDRDAEDYMLLCGSCNRAKSWSCEHCQNLLTRKDERICRHCYWGSPEDYDHVALRPIRRLLVSWSGREIRIYEKLEDEAQAHELSLPDYVKAVLARHISSQ